MFVLFTLGAEFIFLYSHTFTEQRPPHSRVPSNQKASMFEIATSNFLENVFFIASCKRFEVENEQKQQSVLTFSPVDFGEHWCMAAGQLRGAPEGWRWQTGDEGTVTYICSMAKTKKEKRKWGEKIVVPLACSISKRLSGQWQIDLSLQPNLALYLLCLSVV